MWGRREIENYVCSEQAIIAYARSSAEEAVDGPLFALGVAEEREKAMREAISEVGSALQTLEGLSPWSADVKASDQVLTPVFRAYSRRLGIFNDMAKKNCHRLVKHIHDGDLDSEINEKLDAISKVAAAAQPRR